MGYGIISNFFYLIPCYIHSTKHDFKVYISNIKKNTIKCTLIGLIIILKNTFNFSNTSIFLSKELFSRTKKRVRNVSLQTLPNKLEVYWEILYL